MPVANAAGIRLRLGLRRRAAALLALALAAPVAAQPVLIGDVEYVRGAGAAQRGGEAPRVLGAGSSVEQEL